MSSDDKKQDDQEDVPQVVRESQEFDDIADDGYSMGDDADVMDAEEIYEDPREEEHDGGEGDDFSEDAPAGNNKMKKMFAPALVLVCALGAGAYIMMNPGLIGGGGISAPVSAPAVQEEIPPQMADITIPQQQPPPTEPVPAMPDAGMPPQPVALEQVQESNVAMPPQEAVNAFGEPTASEQPAATTAEVKPVVDVTEDVGSPPAVAPAEVEIAAATPPASPVVAEAAPVVAAAEVPVVPPAADVPAAEVPVADSAAVPAFPEMPEAPAPVQGAQDMLADQPPQVQEFPHISTAPVSTTPAGHDGAAIPQLEGGGAEEGIVGKGAPASQEATLMPMEEKPVSAMPEQDNYFDSKLTVPTNKAAVDTGPRKVDPVLEPGSKFVVVNKTYNAQSQESLMISASRALKLGRYEAAIEMYDSLYGRNPKDPAILMGRAVAYQKAGRTDTALKIYDELLAVDKDNEGALLNMLGLLREQYPEVALRRLMNLHEQYPGNAGISAQIGLTQADLGQYDDALRYLGMAASVEPKNAQHMFNMGIVADRKGDKAQAVKFYEQALEIDAVYGGGRSIPREKIYDRLSALRRG